MDDVLTSAEMRAIEAAAIASGRITGAEMMERAGRAVVAAMHEVWPVLGTTPHRAAVLCGPGNNGGDGFVVARLLAWAGWRVELALWGDPDALPQDARAACARWREMGEIVCLPADSGPGAAWQTGACDVAIDAVFGIGLRRPLPRWLAAIGPFGAGGGARRVAIDVPSGLCADSGRVLAGGGVIDADLTVTFHAPKPGHLLADGPAHCGSLAVRPIGLGPQTAGGAARLHIVGSPLPALLSKARRGAGAAHKFTHGHALVLGGGPGRGGAARLAARAALRVGAGLVTLLCPPEALTENAARLDAVMLRPLADGAALRAALADRRIGALCLGPSLGEGAREAGIVAAALGPGADGAPLPVVLDADALTILAGRPDLRAGLHPRCVLTPHGGEFARLCPDLARALAEPAPTGPAMSRLDAARAAAGRLGAVLLLKGPDTLIVAPDGRSAIHAAVYDRAAPWLATAGAGDVLAGLICGLLARGFDPFEAACTAAWLHVEAARRFGPGLIAEDLPDALPGVLAALPDGGAAP
jgi:hydroxyethylthiazole kinase-like uncharacterized protein yjeF